MAINTVATIDITIKTATTISTMTASTTTDTIGGIITATMVAAYL